MNSLVINQKKIPFELRKSKRAKRLTLKIDVENAKLIMTVPRFTFKFEIQNFLNKHEQWIASKWHVIQQKIKEKPQLERSPQYYKAKAKKVIRERLEHFNRHYQFDYNRVFFKNQKTRWGSCSSKRNLNFNWRLILAPLDILDYVVVHELCHLQEMNHSKAFWTLVSEQIPDHKKRRRWLKENHCLLSI